MKVGGKAGTPHDRTEQQRGIKAPITREGADQEACLHNGNLHARLAALLLCLQQSAKSQVVHSCRAISAHQ